MYDDDDDDDVHLIDEFEYNFYIHKIKVRIVSYYKLYTHTLFIDFFSGQIPIKSSDSEKEKKTTKIHNNRKLV